METTKLTDSYVMKTYDYEMFKTLKGNRDINKNHLQRIKHSFQKEYLISPILINEHYEIIDGQHRFEAAKELNLPIHFIQVNGYGLKEVQILNTNMKNWGKLQYLKSWCDLKHPEYLRFRNFMRQFPDFGITSCEVLLTDKIGPKAFTVKYFEEGGLYIPDYNKSVENAQKILMIKPYYDGYNRILFVRAMIGIFRIDYYDHEQLITKLNTNPNSLQHCNNVTQYRLMIEDVYNYRSRQKVSLRYS